MRLRVTRAAILALPLLVGCKASVQAEVHTGSNEQAEESEAQDKLMETPVAPSAAEAPVQELALFGVRQDLSYAGPTAATCKCLAVAVGQPTDPAFRWSGKPPRTDPEAQVVVAVSSSGIACPEAGERAQGASYWGYEASGNDVIVVVEAAEPGRPVASGAIVPRPPGNGQIYVRPLDKKLPYGRPPSGSGDRCKVSHLTPVAPKPGAPAPSGGVRIRTDEPEATSPKSNVP